MKNVIKKFQSLFYWITYSYGAGEKVDGAVKVGFNPYFTGLPILISALMDLDGVESVFQSLFYWITYSYME